jgi:bacteriocin biosynthesis cyclodehydratase domain-containing protein
MAALTDDVELAVAAGIDLVLLSRDEVLVQHGTRSRPSDLFRDDELTGLLGQLVEALRSAPVAVATVVDAVAPEQQSEARRVIEELFELGILVDVRRDLVEQYLAHTFEGETAFDARRVALVGRGKLGARIGSILAEHGLDDVEILEPGFEPDLLRAGIESAHLTIVASDRFELALSQLVNRVCLQGRRPWLFAALDGNRGLVGPLFLPPYTACFNDYWTLVAATTPSPVMASAYRRRTRTRSDDGSFPGLPVFADITAGHAALAAIHFLVRDTSFAVGRQVAVDFDTLRIDVEDVLKLPRCPVCGPARSAARPVFAPEVAEDPSIGIGLNVPAGSDAP